MCILYLLHITIILMDNLLQHDELRSKNIDFYLEIYVLNQKLSH